VRTSIPLAGALGLLLLFAGCRPSTAPGRASTPSAQSALVEAGDVAARVNGQLISMAVFNAQAEAAVRAYYQQPGNSPDAEGAEAAEQALRSQVLELLIDQVLIEQAAAGEGIAVDESQVTAEVESVRAQDPDGFAGWLAANGFTEESFHAQVRADLLAAAVREHVAGTVVSPAEQVHLRQVVVGTRAEAEELIGQIQAGTATVEDLAQAHSLDEASRDQGGDIGFAPRGVLPLAVEEVAFGLQPGDVAGPIESAAGWYLIQLVERDPAREVAPEVLAGLQQQSFARWLAGERAKAQIDRYVQ
jgi:parvulin-like peptidyl-prolyl isomerase